MATDGSRLAHVFIWKEGTMPDLQYARQVLSVVNPDAAKAVEGDNPPISLFSIAPPWPTDLWARAILDLHGSDVSEIAGTDWTDASRYDLAGWQGTDRRTSEHIFVVTAYNRFAPLLTEGDLEGASLGAPSQATTGAAPRLPVAQVPYYPLRPTGPLDWPPAGEATATQPAGAVQPNLVYGSPDPVGSAAAYSALIDSYKPFYVGFGPRVAAGLLDFFFMSILQLITVALASRGAQATGLGGWLGAYWLYACLAVAIFAAYHVLQWGVWGQTIGKKLMGLKVVAPDGEAPGWGRSLLRMLGYFFSFSLGGWGIVMIAFDLRHQALHDKLADTFVVPEKPTVPAPAGLPGYKLPGPAHRPGSTGEPPIPAPAMGPASAVGMANVAGAQPYNEIQIDMGEEASLGSEGRQADWVGRNLRAGGQSPSITRPATGTPPLPITSPTFPVGLGRWPAAEGTTVPNLERTDTGPFTEAIVTQQAIRDVAIPISQQPSPGILQARTLFKAGLTQMEMGVSPGLRGYKVEPGSARAAAVLFKQALERVPGSVVYRYFYAIALRYSEGFERAISELRQVLEQDPTHYEARRQVAYGPRWHDAFAYPGWVSPAPVDTGAPLPPAIRALLPPGQQPATRLMLLREGGLKVAAFLSRTPRVAWNTLPRPEMPARLQLFLSRTPFGPIIALYIVVQDDEQNPYIGETFLNPHDPGTPSEDACQLGQNMLEQLARQDRTYLIFADENDRLLLSRKLVFDAPTQVSAARMLYEVQTLPPQAMDQGDFRRAAQWHMDHFSLDELKVGDN